MSTNDRKSETAATIATLRTEMDAAKAAWAEAVRKYNTALCAASKFQEGDVIQSADGALAKVVRVYVKFDTPRIRAVLKKKDGTWGTREASMWRTEWEQATLQERAA